MSLASAHVLSEDDLDDLIYFSRTGDLNELKASVEILFTHGHAGHDFIASAVDANNGNTPLHMAAANGYLDVLRYILSVCPNDLRSAMLNAQNTAGNTALHWASMNGHLDVCKFLVQMGADADIKNKAGFMAGSEAERAGKDEIVGWLLANGSDGKEGTETDEQVEQGDAGPKEATEGATSHEKNNNPQGEIC